MAQFDVHRNASTATRQRIPYLLDVQADLLRALGTRLVVPLARPEVIQNTPIKFLNPLFLVDGTEVVMLTAEMAGVPLKVLGARVATLSARQHEIIRAVDVLLSGV